MTGRKSSYEIEFWIIESKIEAENGIQNNQEVLFCGQVVELKSIKLRHELDQTSKRPWMGGTWLNTEQWGLHKTCAVPGSCTIEELVIHWLCTPSWPSYKSRHWSRWRGSEGSARTLARVRLWILASSSILLKVSYLLANSWQNWHH